MEEKICICNRCGITYYNSCIQKTRYKTTYNAVSPGLQLKTTNNIQLPRVPQCIILVYVQVNKSTSPDTFYSVKRLSVNFGGKCCLLASMDQKKLYEMSRDNGIQFNWWLLCNKFIIIDPIKDLLWDVDPNDAEYGVNLQMDITFNNKSGDDANVDLCVLVCENGSTFSSFLNLSDDDVVDAC